MNIYQDILCAKKEGRKLLALLIDPDKLTNDSLAALVKKINTLPVTHIFVGGSLVENNVLDHLLTSLKEVTSLPVILFPGDPSQLSDKADGLLFLQLLSGRNPTYLIDYQLAAVPVLKDAQVEIISTAYLLIDGGKESAVQRVSQTQPMSRTDVSKVVDTCIAGMWMGSKLIYLEAGSGALFSVPKEMITEVHKAVDIPVIVGGGIRSAQMIEEVYQAGADLVVIGTAFENDTNFFNS
ncbi:MAG: geranylgeranylglyceryl/heptaprenylglyceryl phosphate synthase [Flavobacterium sp.]|nr:geranylgeranylglyceryl/heptaprenylglyceryl phosphate synthase [Candidatus Neoflavobacterium equi]